MIIVTDIFYLLLFFVGYSVAVLDLEELANIQYAIDILDKPLLFDENVKQNEVVLSNIYGQLYQCQYEPVASYNSTGQEGEANAPETAVVDLLKVMADEPCLVQTTGWWTYELCYKQEIKQYHMEDGKISGDVISLGHYASEFNWNDAKQKSKAEYAGRFHSQEYTNGSVCDLTGELRATSVRFKCHESVSDGIDSVEEPMTCKYIMTVRTNKICQHPDLRILSQKKSVPIVCQPLLNAAEYAQYIEHHAADTATSDEASVSKEDEKASKSESETGTTVQPESIVILTKAAEEVLGDGDSIRRVLVGTLVEKLKNALAREKKEQDNEEEEEEEEEKDQSKMVDGKEEKLENSKPEKEKTNKLSTMMDPSSDLKATLDDFLAAVSSEMNNANVKHADDSEDEEEEEKDAEKSNFDKTDVAEENSRPGDSLHDKADMTADSDDEKTMEKDRSADGEQEEELTGTAEVEGSVITWQGQGNQIQQITIDTNMKAHVRQRKKVAEDEQEKDGDAVSKSEQKEASNAKSTPPTKKVEVRIIGAGYQAKDGKPLSLYADDFSIGNMVFALLQHNDDEVAEFEKQKRIEENYRFNWSKKKQKKNEL